MSRRCKKGQRARVIGGGSNHGVIVLVVRSYFSPQVFDGSTWHGYRFPWVVTSLGRPLHFVYLNDGTDAPPTQSGVLEDEDLEPLQDDDDGLTESENSDIPSGFENSTA